MKDWMPYVNSILILIVGLIVAFIYRTRDSSKIEREKAEARIRKLEDRMAESEFKVTPLWAKIQKTLSEDLHHPHVKDKEMDKLLEKLEALTLNPTETARLKELLVHRTKDLTVPENERASASIMATVMDKVLIEAQTNGPTEVSAVAVPVAKET